MFPDVVTPVGPPFNVTVCEPDAILVVETLNVTVPPVPSFIVPVCVVPTETVFNGGTCTFKVDVAIANVTVWALFVCTIVTGTSIPVALYVPDGVPYVILAVVGVCDNA